MKILKAIKKWFALEYAPDPNPVGSKVIYLGVEWTMKHKIRGVDVMHRSYDTLERINPMGQYEEIETPQDAAKSPNSEVKPDCAPSGLLGALGFVRGTGFDGEVWTNPENIHLSQVWIHFSGDFQKWGAAYDARAGFDLGAFFRWWCSQSKEEDAFAQLGDER